jgi:hypothetical protein
MCKAAKPQVVSSMHTVEEPTIVEVVRDPQKSQRKSRKRKRQTSPSRTRKTRVSRKCTARRSHDAR